MYLASTQFHKHCIHSSIDLIVKFSIVEFYTQVSQRVGVISAKFTVDKISEYSMLYFLMSSTNYRDCLPFKMSSSRNTLINCFLFSGVFSCFLVFCVSKKSLLVFLSEINLNKYYTIIFLHLQYEKENSKCIMKSHTPK